MLTGPEKAVVFLLSLDEAIAGPIVAELGEAELSKLRAVAATMRQVEASAAEDTYRDFVERSARAVAVPRGGLTYLRRLTVRALGDERARHVFDEGNILSPLAKLEAAQPEAIAALLEREPAQLAAALLTRLDPRVAAAVIVAMPAERQAAVLARVSRMTELPAGALEEIASAIAAELPDGHGSATVGIDGTARAAEILNATPREVASTLLAALELEDAGLSKGLRLAMFTFTDLARLDARAMRSLLREVPNERLPLALNGAPEELRVAIFAGLSSRAADLLRDEMELLGRAKKADIEAARIEIVEIALRLESEGGIDLGRE